MNIDLKKVKFKNFLSYGETWNEVEFKTGVDIIMAKNGQGKCLRGNTLIDIQIDDTLVLAQMKDFLDEKYSRKNY